MTKARRGVYSHNDMGELEAVLKSNSDAERKLIITDGVFSMDGDIAPLDEVSKLAEEYGSMVYVDDCHGEGVLGEKGAGIASEEKRKESRKSPKEGREESEERNGESGDYKCRGREVE